jgi:hypothetical protein
MRDLAMKPFHPLEGKKSIGLFVRGVFPISSVRVPLRSLKGDLAVLGKHSGVYSVNFKVVLSSIGVVRVPMKSCKKNNCKSWGTSLELLQTE